MLIHNAVRLIHSVSDSWVRMQQYRKVHGGLEIVFSIHNGQRGKEYEQWSVNCRGIHETRISAFDGGGLRVYSSSHSAARQYIARRAELRWLCPCDQVRGLAALFHAHLQATDDWIPFDRYLPVNALRKVTDTPSFLAPNQDGNFVSRGPDFLIRVYFKALESADQRVRFTLRGSPKPNLIRPKVLHFGESYVVANSFDARRL